MEVTHVTAIVAAVAAISGLILGWSGKARTIKQDTKEEASRGAVLRADMDYIKRGVDDIRLDQRSQSQRIDVLAERVTRVEESTKQAHHRINRLDGQKED